ncbi:MAG: hypothetical protein JXP48_06550 [Acidobacteria bacterium]|nr:hypothetical protein [Acidobacteriota bacterium]
MAQQPSGGHFHRNTVRVHLSGQRHLEGYMTAPFPRMKDGFRDAPGRVMELAPEGDHFHLRRQRPAVSIEGDSPYPVRFQQEDHGQPGPGFVPEPEHRRGAGGKIARRQPREILPGILP